MPVKKNVIALWDQYKKTSLYKASKKEHYTIVKFLLSKVANVILFCNLFKDTSLHKHEQKKHGSTVRILQSYSADTT